MEQLLETTLDAINQYDIDIVLGTGGNVEEFGEIAWRSGSR